MGVIAEDDSDVAVLRAITLTLLRPHKIGFKPFVGNGCGKLRRKCSAWAKTLVQRGCTWIVVVHDLDANDEAELRTELSNAISPARPRASVVLIPKREIEAWLLYDAGAIAKVFREQSQVGLPGDPESLADPKKHLRNLIRTSYHKDYLSTLHNELIARHIDTSNLERSTSFRPHVNFTRTVRAVIRPQVSRQRN